MKHHEFIAGKLTLRNIENFMIGLAALHIFLPVLSDFHSGEFGNFKAHFKIWSPAFAGMTRIGLAIGILVIESMIWSSIFNSSPASESGFSLSPNDKKVY